MPRVKRGTHRRASRKKVLEQASGYFLTKSKLYRAAQEAVERGLKFAYVGRKLKKREYRSLWIVRINASCRAAGVSYSQFVRGLKAAGLDLNRKVLADIALHDEAGFLSLVQAARAALDAKPGPDAEPAPGAILTPGQVQMATVLQRNRSELKEMIAQEDEIRRPLADPAPEAKPALRAEPAAESESGPENA